MRKKLIFHIGFPKTGTTSIQMFLADKRDALSEAGILFPAVPGQYGNYGMPGRSQGPHADLILRFCSGSEPTIMPSDINWGTVFAEFHQDSRHNTIVVSNESQSVKSHRIRRELYIDAIGVGQAEFLAYVREPVSWLNSMFIQATEAWGSNVHAPAGLPTVEKFLDRGITGMLAPFREIGKITLRNYDDLRMGDNLLPDVLNLIDAPHLLPAVGSAERRNEKRFEPEEVLLLQAVRQTGATLEQFMELKRALRVTQRRRERRQHRKLQRISHDGSASAADTQRTLLLPEQLQKQIKAIWAAERPRLEDQYGLSLPDTPMQESPAILSISPRTADQLRHDIGSELSPDAYAAFKEALSVACAYDNELN